MEFRKATKKQSRLRMAIDGPSGAGKTFTALIAAFALAGDGGRVAVIDTERGSASKYADQFPEFDVLELTTFSPETYTRAIKIADEAGYDVLVIDSLSHAWEGEEGALDQVDKRASRGGGNSYTAWRDVTPMHRRMVDAMLQSRCHLIATMRSKMEYVLEPDSKGRMVPRKVGLAPIQRQGIEYEFDVVADMDLNHKLVVSKTRCPAIDGQEEIKPQAQWFAPIAAWLTDGAPLTETTSHPSSQPGGGAGEATRPPAADPVDWKSVARGFTQSELPKALFEACRTYWTAKGLNQDEVREAFVLVRDDYRADPDQCLADMSDLARKVTAKEATK